MSRMVLRGCPGHPGMGLGGPHTYHSTLAASIVLPMAYLCIISFGIKERVCASKTAPIDNPIQYSQPTTYGEPEAQSASESLVT